MGRLIYAMSGGACFVVVLFFHAATCVVCSVARPARGDRTVCWTSTYSSGCDGHDSARAPGSAEPTAADSRITALCRLAAAAALTGNSVAYFDSSRLNAFTLSIGLLSHSAHSSIDTVTCTNECCRYHIGPPATSSHSTLVFGPPVEPHRGRPLSTACTSRPSARRAQPSRTARCDSGP